MKWEPVGRRVSLCLGFWLEVNSQSEGKPRRGKGDGEEEVVVDQQVHLCVNNTGERFGLCRNPDGLIEHFLIASARVAELA